MKRLKKSVVDLPPYRVAQDGGVVKLNQNESPLDVPDAVKQEILRRLRGLSWNRYPKLWPGDLIDRIAEYTRFPSSGIVIGNGSNELVQTVIHATCESGDMIVVVDPGFPVYERVAAGMGIKAAKVPLKVDFSFDAPSIIRGAETARLVILSSPNNPTGTALSMVAVEEIAKSIDCILAIDEAYYEFHGESAQRLINEVDNVVVMRTFSKAFSMAGARLGYLLGRGNVVEHLEKAKLPFSVGVFQQVAGEVLLENADLVRDNVNLIVRERERLFHELNSLDGVSPVPSRTNFILFAVEDGDARFLCERLHKKGVLVRQLGGPRLRSMLRVTVGTPEENEAFMDAMRRVLGG